MCGYEKQSRSMNKKLCEETRVFARRIQHRANENYSIFYEWIGHISNVRRWYLLIFQAHLFMLFASSASHLFYFMKNLLKQENFCVEEKNWVCGSQETNFIIPCMFIFILYYFNFYFIKYNEKTTQFIFTLPWTCLLFAPFYFYSIMHWCESERVRIKCRRMRINEKKSALEVFQWTGKLRVWMKNQK